MNWPYFGLWTDLMNRPYFLSVLWPSHLEYIGPAYEWACGLVTCLLRLWCWTHSPQSFPLTLTSNLCCRLFSSCLTFIVASNDLLRPFWPFPTLWNRSNGKLTQTIMLPIMVAGSFIWLVFGFILFVIESCYHQSVQSLVKLQNNRPIALNCFYLFWK